MNWQADLKAKIDALKDEDWQEAFVTAPGREPEMMRVAKVEVPCNYKTGVNLGFSVGSVNADEFCGVPRGQLLLESMQAGCGEHEAMVRFAVYPVELLRPDGAPAYHYVDFAERAEGRY